MSSLFRSLSLPSCLKPKSCELEDVILTRLPPSDGRYYHKHPLILSTYVKENVDQKDLCDICSMYLTWGSPIYSCSRTECDDVFLHKWCAVLPKRITNLLHPEHILWMHGIRNFNCCKCGEDISGCGYGCIVCDDKFQLHFKCALQDIPLSIDQSTTGTGTCTSSLLSRSLSLPVHVHPQNVSLIRSSFPKFQIYYLEKTSQNAKIQHSSHKHPLVLMKYFKRYYSDDCVLCGTELLPDVLSYGCCADCNFFIHESCSKLPQNMRTTFHPAHILKYTSLKTKTLTCICAKEISGGIGYYCALCDFSLHCECASTHIFEDHKEHKFIYLKASIYTCDACGVTENKECTSCVCSGCHLQVHKKCSYSPFPRTVKQRRHSQHKLRLTYFFESSDVDFANRMCMICFNKINNVYCMYQCTKCAYITHVTCSTTEDIIIYMSDEIEEEEFIPSTIATTAEDTEEQQQVKFFKHPHDLVFINEESGTDEICDACVRPIISVPFHKCVNDWCSFRLHKQCFQLPSEIQHPLHAHPLQLLSPCDTLYYFCKLFMAKCYGCDIRCNGFVYGCEDCQFWMDVRCSLLSDTLKHDSHNCTLSLVDYKYVRDKDIVDKAKCSACDCKCESHSLCRYTCALGCNFHLDLGCALLPKRVPHECPRHNWKPNYPLKLMYGAIKDASGIYFCDLCEEPRGEDDWFYYCEDCKWSNHPLCVLGKVQLKYGKTYFTTDVHGHQVKLVKEPEGGSSCDHCRKPCEIQIHVDNARLICENPQLCSAFFCGKCNIHIHVNCALLKCKAYGIWEIDHEIEQEEKESDDNESLGIEEEESDDNESLGIEEIKEFIPSTIS